MATAATTSLFMAPLSGKRSFPDADPPPASALALLAAQLQRGEAGALDRVYSRFAPSLLHLASGLTGSPEAGEDVVHDVFVGLPAAMAGYRETGQFGPWLRRIVARRALDHLRLSARRNEVELEGEADIDLGAVRQPDVATRLVIDAAVAALPDALRIVFILRAVEGYAHAEIGEMLGIPRGTSEVRFHRAIRALRVALEDKD